MFILQGIIRNEIPPFVEFPGRSGVRRMWNAQPVDGFIKIMTNPMKPVIIPWQNIQYRGVSASDMAMEPYFALAEELDIPVGIHTALGPIGSPYTCCPKFRITLGNPGLLEELLIRHPKLRVYIMHGGWPYLPETLALMYMYPQVYADVAVINWILPREEFHHYLQALMRAGLGKRIMFGSDQMIWPEAIGTAIEGVESAKFLTHQQKRDIFYNNAARFLKLEK